MSNEQFAISSIVIFVFFLYSLLESISILPRIAGSQLDKNALGYTFSSMVNTTKRIFIVLYPPLLGWLSFTGKNIWPTIYISYIAGGVAVIVVYIFRNPLINFFIKVIADYGKNGSIIYSMMGKQKKSYHDKNNKYILTAEFKINTTLTISATWVYFIYSSSLFIINILGHIYKDKSAVIYQLVGLINSLGTFIMSFFLDPKVSKNFDEKNNLDITFNSIIIGQFLAITFLGPTVMIALSIALSGI